MNVKGDFSMNEMYEALKESIEIDEFKISKETLNIIEDALNDFDYTEIQYYDEKDLLTFKETLILKNHIKMDLTGQNSGLTQWTRTYVGDIETGLDELVELKENGTVKHTILYNNYNSIFDGKDDVVVSVETIEWNTENNNDEEKEIYKSEMRLYIYVKQDIVDEQSK